MALTTPTHLFPSRVSIQRVSMSKDSKGNPVPTFATVVPSLKCRIRPLTSEQKLEHQKVARETSHTLYCQTKIATGGGSGSSATSEKTIPDLLKGTQSDHNDRHRICETANGATTYYEVDGQFDVNKVGVYTMLDLIEREDAWWNN